MKDLTVGKEGKLIFNFAMPMLLGNVFQIINSIVDRIIVGNYLGKVSVAAVGDAFPVIFALISLFIGVTAGNTIIISQYFGAKDFGNVKRAVDTTYIFLFFASILFTITGLLLCGPVFSLLNIETIVYHEALLYTRIIMGGMILMACSFGTMAILRGLGDSLTPMIFMIAATILNIILEIIFIPVMKMGIEGAAIANVISQGITFVVGIIYLNKKHKIINISFRKMIFDIGIFLKSLKIGLPSGMQQFAVAIGQIFLLKLVNEYGTDTVAAFTIAGSIDSFAMLPAMNFSMALMSFVGQNMGAGKQDRVKKGLISTQMMTAAISISVTILVLIFRDSLMHVFNKDPEVIRLGVEYLTIVSSFYILFSIMFVNTGVFRGAGDTLVPMFITIFSLWCIRIPVAYFLSASMGIHGVFWSLPLAWAIGATFTMIYYKIGRWKKMVIVKQKNI